MGQTLTNGLYLPDEGERNCYSGLKSNWRALDAVIGGYNVHVANLDIHVTAADKTAWNTHIADTVKHVTAADKEAWNGKADDTDAVHKSGAESIAGEKTFTDNTFFNSVRATSSAATGGQGSTILPLFSILTFANGDPSVIARLNFRALGTDGSKSLYPHENNQYTLGLTSHRYSNVFSYNINSNNPGVLSMPDLSAGVDISGYFTTGTTENTYTPTVNGWVCVHGISSITSGIFVENSKGFYASANSMVAFTGTDRYVNLCFPVIGGESYNIVLKSVNTSIAAKFFPCQGNV